ncbi:MAG: hypothetical protein IJP26_03225 [Clostridia bacterium]|nr:hypothetical protein [Clostridia bacterium]
MQNNNISSFAKGTLVGMVAGAALLVGGKMVMNNNHNMSKGSSKAIKAVGEFVDGVQTMFK